MHLEKVACSVSHHLVEEVSAEYPETLRDIRGNILIPETLHFLGFDVKVGMQDKNVSTHHNMMIRSNKDKTRCYKTTVYKGRVRKAIKGVVNGVIEYERHKMHELLDHYNTYEVLQPDDLSKYVKEEDLLYIEDQGGRSTLEECL